MFVRSKEQTDIIGQTAALKFVEKENTENHSSQEQKPLEPDPETVID